MTFGKKYINKKQKLTAGAAVRLALSPVVVSALLTPLLWLAPGGTVAWAATKEWMDITGTGSFSGPAGIAVDSAGNVYVTNAMSDTIEERASGSSTWTDITVNGSLVFPAEIELYATRNVCVTIVSSDWSD